MRDVKLERIDLLADMLLRSREIAVDESLDHVLPALDAALLITGREMARFIAEDEWMMGAPGATLN